MALSCNTHPRLANVMRLKGILGTSLSFMFKPPLPGNRQTLYFWSVLCRISGLNRCGITKAHTYTEGNAASDISVQETLRQPIRGNLGLSNGRGRPETNNIQALFQTAAFQIDSFLGSILRDYLG